MKFILTFSIFLCLLFSSCDDSETGSGPEVNDNIDTTEVVDTTDISDSTVVDSAIVFNRKISLIITIDRSASMNQAKPELGNQTAKDIVINAIEEFISEYPESAGRIGITSFSSGIYPSNIVSEFSSDKDSLRTRLYSISFNQATDYNTAFFGDDSKNAEGVFHLAGNAEHAKHVLFITDGKHTEGVVKDQEIINTALGNTIRITPVAIGFGMPDELFNISENTNGILGEDIYSQDDFDSFLREFLLFASE